MVYRHGTQNTLISSLSLSFFVYVYYKNKILVCLQAGK